MSDGQTDRRTDRILITIPRLHYMQRGNKIRSKLTLSILRNIYFAFVYSHIFCSIEIYANTSSIHLKQDAQLSQRDRAAGYISFGRKWKTGTQRQYFTDIVSLASTTVT